MLTILAPCFLLFIFSASAQTCDLAQDPCIKSSRECGFPLYPVQNGVGFLPYPVCLPKGACADDPKLRGQDGLLHTYQMLMLEISDTRQFHNKRIHVRSSMNVGKNLFPKCITNKHFNRTARTLDFAYGTCDLDTQPTTEDNGNICDLFQPGKIATTDHNGAKDIIRCRDGLMYFAEHSACAQQSQCGINIAFDIRYREDGIVLYRPFRGATITIEVELFQSGSPEVDGSSPVTIGNEQCRQFEGYDRCVGYFTLEFLTSN